MKTDANEDVAEAVKRVHDLAERHYGTRVEAVPVEVVCNERDDCSLVPS